MTREMITVEGSVVADNAREAAKIVWDEVVEVDTQPLASVTRLEITAKHVMRGEPGKTWAYVVEGPAR
jgi:hypothetical protein